MPDTLLPAVAKPMTEDLRWAIMAAAGPNPDAADAWRSLMATMEFSDISPSVQRLAPQIFSNVRDDKAVPSRDRLKGAYRYTWTKNVRLWSMAQGFLSALTESGNDYRLLKGAALHAHRGAVGTRSIGDFDLLVDETDISSVVTVMESCGFRQEGSRQIVCGHSTTDGASINLNFGDCHVDLHVAPWKEPQALLTRMLREAPVRRQVGTTAVLIPPSDLLLLHAAWHATRQTSPTDLAQGLVDVALLSRGMRLADVAEAAESTGSGDAAREAGRLLLGVGIDTGLHGLPTTRRTRSARQATRRFVHSTLDRPRLLRMLRDRHVTGLNWTGDSPDVRMGGIGYQTWLRLGRPGKAERVMGLGRGFLATPSVTVTLPAALEPFAGGDAPRAAISPWRVSAMDWRFRVRLPQKTTKVRVVLDGECLDQLDAGLFVNGAFAGRLIAGDISLREVHCQVSEPALEVSIRPLWGACPACFPSLETLRVTLADLS